MRRELNMVMVKKIYREMCYFEVNCVRVRQRIMVMYKGSHGKST